jgi:hypothetical protein
MADTEYTREQLEIASAQLELLDAAEELVAAKADPNGRELSPAAQALYAIEGARRFAEHHPAARLYRSYDPEFIHA